MTRYQFRHLSLPLNELMSVFIEYCPVRVPRMVRTFLGFRQRQDHHSTTNLTPNSLHWRIRGRPLCSELFCGQEHGCLLLPVTRTSLGRTKEHRELLFTA